MSEFKVGEQTYRINKNLSAMDLIHISRKWFIPLNYVAALKPVEGKTIGTRDYARALLATTSQLANEDVEQTIRKTLSVVSRQQPGGATWAPVVAGGKIMFEDIDPLEMLELVWIVFDHHRMLSFFSAAPATS